LRILSVHGSAADSQRGGDGDSICEPFHAPSLLELIALVLRKLQLPGLSVAFELDSSDASRSNDLLTQTGTGIARRAVEAHNLPS
jgi:hypothetical protein